MISIGNLIELLIERLSRIGSIPICNGIADRAPHIMGYCFPLCYRCTFIILGFLGSLFLLKYKKIRIPLILCIICLLPMIIDGGMQTFYGIMSTNIRRSVTGGLFGISMGYMINAFIGYIERSF